MLYLLGITLPELVEVIEGEQVTWGYALDIGCGTGTNAIYLAQQRKMENISGYEVACFICW